MSAPIVAIIPHRLGKTEASRRLKEGLGRTPAGLANLLSLSPATWDGDRVTFQVRALGQTATAAIDVMEQELRLELMLPWFLEKLASRIVPALRKETQLLLEKK
jgi:hypothetical protein